MGSNPTSDIFLAISFSGRQNQVRMAEALPFRPYVVRRVGSNHSSDILFVFGLSTI